MINASKEALGKCARALREEEDITLTAFAKMIGVSLTSCSLFENGKVDSKNTAEKYADVLGITVEKLNELALEYEEPEKEEKPKEEWKPTVTNLDTVKRIKGLMKEKQVSMHRLAFAIDRDTEYITNVMDGYGEFTNDEFRTIANILSVDFTYLKAGGPRSYQMEAIAKVERQAREAAARKKEDEEATNTLAAVKFILEHIQEISGSREQKINAHRVLCNIRTEAEIKLLFK